MNKILLMFVFLCVSAASAFAQHSVQLTAVDPNNPTGTDYNFYRQTGTCPVIAPTTTTGFTLLNSTPVAVKVYVDNTVSGGVTYCYIATAIPAAGGTQSAPSPDTQAVVPSVVPPTMLQITVLE